MNSCLRPHIRRFEGELQRKLFGASTEYVVQFDVRDLTKIDFQGQQNGFWLGRQGGWLSVNDIREAQGLNPIGPQGDVYLEPQNMIDASKALQKPPADTQ